MKKKFIILITVVILFILGFVIPVLFSSGRTACTMMGCPCVEVEGERPCNSCTRSRPVFNLGLIKTVEKCRGTEIITCKNDKQVDRRVDFSNQECRYDWYAFGINLRYLGNNPGGLREFPTEEREESPEDETANWKESVEKVVEEYESALKTRKRDRVLPYTTGELKKEVQG